MLKQATFFIALLAIHAFIAAQDAAPASENLITNPSFEEKAGDAPRGWHVRATDPAYITDGVAGDTTHTGTAAVRLSNPKDWHQRWAANNDQRIRVEGGQTLRFSAWVKVSGMDGRQFVQLRLEQFDAEGKILKDNMAVQGERHRPAAGEWVQISDELTVHADARLVRPLLVLASSNPESTATATFDDVELVRRP